MIRSYVTICIVYLLSAHHLILAQQWSQRAPLLVPNSETCVAQLDEQIYVMGGYPSTRVTATTVQVYEAGEDGWQLTTPLPVAVNHCMAAGVNGKLYLIGGQTHDRGGPDEAGFTDSVYVYDPDTAEWRAQAAMPTKRSGGVAVVVDGKIYVAGGRPPQGSDFAVYDTEKNAWRVLPDLPTQRNHLAGAAIDGRIYIAGGRFGSGFRSEVTDVFEVFDPTTNSWTAQAPMPTQRGGINGIEANGCFQVWGGEWTTGVFAEHEVYNPMTDQWQRVGSVATPVHGVTGAAFIDGWIHLPGGGTEVGGTSGSTIHQVYRAEMVCR